MSTPRKGWSWQASIYGSVVGARMLDLVKHFVSGVRDSMTRSDDTREDPVRRFWYRRTASGLRVHVHLGLDGMQICLCRPHGAPIMPRMIRQCQGNEDGYSELELAALSKAPSLPT